MKSQTSTELRENRARLIRIYRKYFDQIASGKKTIEVRVGWSSMRKIEPGQLLRFVCQDDSCLTRVVAVREYGSFAELLEKENPERVNPGKTSSEQLVELRQIFPKDKEELGVLAIEIEIERSNQS